MKVFRITKLFDAILIQSRLSKREAQELAESLEDKTNWEIEYNYQEIVRKELAALGLLRSQNTKSCKIHKGTRIQ